MPQAVKVTIILIRWPGIDKRVPPEGHPLVERSTFQGLGRLCKWGLHRAFRDRARAEQVLNVVLADSLLVQQRIG